MHAISHGKCCCHQNIAENRLPIDGLIDDMYLEGVDEVNYGINEGENRDNDEMPFGETESIEGHVEGEADHWSPMKIYIVGNYLCYVMMDLRVTPSMLRRILNRKPQKMMVIGNYMQNAISYKIST